VTPLARSALVALCALLVTPVAAALRAPTPGWVLEPGRALGPITMGMTRAELGRVGPVSPHPAGSLGPNVLVSRAWTFFLDPQGRLRIARRPLGLTPGVVIAGRRIAPAATLNDIARMRIAGCTPIQRRVGGNVITCRARWGWTHLTEGAVSRGRVEVDISRDR
jgi:hypothetical protein